MKIINGKDDKKSKKESLRRIIFKLTDKELYELFEKTITKLMKDQKGGKYDKRENECGVGIGDDAVYTTDIACNAFNNIDNRKSRMSQLTGNIRTKIGIQQKGKGQQGQNQIDGAARHLQRKNCYYDAHDDIGLNGIPDTVGGIVGKLDDPVND